MGYKAMKRKFTLSEQEKIGDALSRKKAKCETDNNDFRMNKSAWSENESGNIYLSSLETITHFFVNILST